MVLMMVFLMVFPIIIFFVVGFILIQIGGTELNWIYAEWVSVLKLKYVFMLSTVAQF